jgi:type I restriction enzyme S subunit
MVKPEPLIDLRPDYLAIVQDILREHLCGVEVWAYGSRAAWTDEEYSDLDLVARNHPDPLQNLDFTGIEDAREAFTLSNLPFRVELFDWARLPVTFHGEIEKGYVVVQGREKQAGGLPSGWREVTLADIADIIPGFAFKGEHFSDDGEEKVIKIKDIQEPFIDLGNATQVLIKNYSEKKLQKFLISKGDFAIAMTGATIGKIGKFIDNKSAYINQRVAKFDAKKNSDKGFIYYIVRNPDFKNFVLNNIDSQSAQGNISSSSLGKYKFFCPPLPEQKAIAAILGALDDKIEANCKMNATLEAIARALFKSWFVDFDPVRTKAEDRPSGLPADLDALFPASFTDSLLGEIPMGWRVKSLDDIADFLNGLALQKYPAAFGEEFLPVIKIAQLRQGRTDNSDRASTNVPSNYVVEDGDVLFSWSGSLTQVLWTGGRGALNQHLFKVSSPNYPKWLHYYWVEHHLPWFQSIAASKATTMGHIQRHHLKEALVTLPTDAILKAADGVFSPLFARRLEVGLENQTLATLRDTLLPKLISGQIRVGDAEKLAEGAA